MPARLREWSWRTTLLATVLVAAAIVSPASPALPAPCTVSGSAPVLAAASIDRTTMRRVDRVLRDLVARAERAALRGGSEREETLRAWLMPRLTAVGADPSPIASRAFDRHSRIAEADTTVRLALRALSADVPEVDPADVPAILRNRPEYPTNPAAAPDLIRRLEGAPAIATLRARRAPSLAERLLALEQAAAKIEPHREAVERLRAWTRRSLETIPGELGAASLVLADLEELAALAHRGWPTAKAKRRVAESIDEIAEFGSPRTLAFLLAAIDAMPEIAGRCVQRVERRGDGGLRLEFARSAIDESDRRRWRERLGGTAGRRRGRLSRPRGPRSTPARLAATRPAERVPSDAA